MESPASVSSPWHRGEIALQRLLGLEERMDEVGRRLVRAHLIDQHMEFYPLLPMVVLGAVDLNGDVWATIRTGPPGFLHALDAKRLAVELNRDADDPAEIGMDDGSALALLGIDLGTRRRNRLNGSLRRRSGGLDLFVKQSFGNCPKYIHLRESRFFSDPAAPSCVPPVESSTLEGAARILVHQADTFFVATYADISEIREIDVSHRGGRTGFVHVGKDGCLTIPDFSGNRFFNTLGNIILNPRAGLCFPDFSSGSLLQMSGEAELLFEHPGGRPIDGAERYWRFRPRRIVWRERVLPIRCDMKELSPFTRATGTW